MILSTQHITHTLGNAAPIFKFFYVKSVAGAVFPAFAFCLSDLPPDPGPPKTMVGVGLAEILGFMEVVGVDEGSRDEEGDNEVEGDSVGVIFRMIT